VTFPRRPAAYIPAAASGPGALASEHAMAQAARQRGWPAPEMYADALGRPGEPGPALDRLEAAITAGRHDALLLPLPRTLGDPAPLMRLLARCTQQGVAVSLVLPPAAEGPDVTPRAADAPASPLSREAWSMLARARLEALAEIYPDWRIWLDQHGWHARRRGQGFVQGYRPGAPVFYVVADTATGLAAQLCWQQAADTHAPDGCLAHILPPPPWGQPAESQPSLSMSTAQRRPGAEAAE
jgi:hypothetical protein